MIKALSIASTGMGAQQMTIEVISNNLANVSTVGFKKSVAEFQDLLYQTLKAAGTSTGAGNIPVGMQVGSGVRPVAVHREFRQGDFQKTEGPLDLAIEGDGFFQLTLPDGSTAYTRAGGLKLDAEGKVVTAEGLALVPNLSVPTGTKNITISQDGTVSVLTGAATTPTIIGNVELARFINPAGLDSLGKNLFKTTAASGEPVTGRPGLEGFGTILQGSLEGSNVDIAAEMVNMIVAQRAYELNAKSIQTSDEMLQLANNLKR